MLTAQEVLDKEFLEMRCQIIEIAASLDRVDRAAEKRRETFDEPRLRQVYDALRLVAQPGQSQRSELVLMLFSDEPSNRQPA